VLNCIDIAFFYEPPVIISPVNERMPTYPDFPFLGEFAIIELCLIIFHELCLDISMLVVLLLSR
jgi:hypothetical protein